jgi:hypothetical protein
MHDPIPSAPPRPNRRGGDRGRFGWRPSVNLVLKSGSRQTALLRDLSTSGVGLMARAPIEPGTMLSVELLTWAGGAVTHQAQVVHLTPMRGGTWLLGCEWERPLDDNELRRGEREKG